MLEEFRFLKASFEGAMTWRDERFKNFINIIFGTAALLAVIAQLSKTKAELHYSIIIISIILFLYGLFVFSRLVAGSFSIRKYRRAINKVRKYFVDMDIDLEEYLVIPVNAQKKTPSKVRLGSGLIGTTAFTNSLLLSVFGIAAMMQMLNWQVLLSALIGLVLAVLSWFFHTIYYGIQVKRQTKKNKEKNRKFVSVLKYSP